MPSDGMKEYRVAPTAAEAHARFVWIDDEGRARELSPDECKYLATPFAPTDGGRPYVKRYYTKRTPDRRMIGYLEREKLPKGLEVHPYDGHGEFGSAY